MQPCYLNIHKTWNVYICGTVHELETFITNEHHENIMNMFLDHLCIVEQYINVTHMGVSEPSYQ